MQEFNNDNQNEEQPTEYVTAHKESDPNYDPDNDLEFKSHRLLPHLLV